MAHTLVQIGNSKALIIPAKLIKAKKYDSKTEFDIIEMPDGFRIVRKNRSIDALEFPKAAKPAIPAKVESLRNVVRFSEEELEQDDRLSYILSR